ncbi:MAG: GNAT family N-acetyltransferase [Chthoniobacterales bacterium]|nr:GNAT family N-acetyltransferase [Chthoniobacterales bacterium]
MDQPPVPVIPLPEHYHFASASRADEKELRAVIIRAVAHDTSWGDAIHEVNAMMQGWLDHAFAPESNGICLALRHGSRIIGASILVPNPAAEDHLAPGPCVQMEYRNRGLGSALLGESLRQLREAGLAHATAVAKGNGPVAKFLYPKCNGMVTPGTTPLLAACAPNE